MKRRTLTHAGLLLLIGLPQALLAVPAPVPKTGQTWSVFPKDDGALQKGVAWPVPRFTPRVNVTDDTGAGGGVAGNGICDGSELCNGAVLDRLTGLTWLKNAACFGKQTLQAAVTSANQLVSGQCGLRDGSKAGSWRLPNRNELLSLVDLGCVRPSLPDRFGTDCFRSDPSPVFSNVQQSYYWSSSTSAYDTSLGWYVSFYGGNTTSTAYSNPYYTWPVRGGQ
jgi:hypothetical protein